MEFDVAGLMNYGAMGICLGYFIWKDQVNQKNYKELFISTVGEFRNTLSNVENMLVVLEKTACLGDKCQVGGGNGK